MLPPAACSTAGARAREAAPQPGADGSSGGPGGCAQGGVTACPPVQEPPGAARAAFLRAAAEGLLLQGLTAVCGSGAPEGACAGAAAQAGGAGAGAEAHAVGVAAVAGTAPWAATKLPPPGVVRGTQVRGRRLTLRPVCGMRATWRFALCVAHTPSPNWAQP